MNEHTDFPTERMNLAEIELQARYLRAQAMRDMVRALRGVIARRFVRRHTETGSQAA